MKTSELLQDINGGVYDAVFKELYGDKKIGRRRSAALCRSFMEKFGDREDSRMFSAPGRTELIGNHTDHNGGQAVAAAIDRDILAVAAPEADRVDVCESDTEAMALLEERPDRGSSAALAWGMAKRFGGGFVACTDSTIPIGKGLSSSAAFSVLCGKIADTFHGGGRADAVALALAAMQTENEDYGKSCGLLDQTVCAVGGTVHIDFGTEPPRLGALDYSFDGYRLFLVDTGVSHVGCEAGYAAIAEDMKAAAAYYGKQRLGDVPPELFDEKKERMRMKLGDRVYRRAQHFFDENRRVGFFCRRALGGQTEHCLYAVNGSGISSRANLGNVHARADEATAALKETAAAVRIHGGGFGGAIQCYVKTERVFAFSEKMEAMFGKGCIIPVNIRKSGVIAL